MSGRVRGKRLIATGGARGMGASHARHLAEEGAAVVIGDVLDAQGAELAAELQADDLDVQYTHLDVTDESSWKCAIVVTPRRLGGIDGLVNNAGVTGTADGYVTNTPLGRMAEPVEVSKAVLFLLSNDAGFITGSDLVIDGGYLAR